jgi:putative transposase
MAYRQRTGMAAMTQSILTDDPDFLRFIVERVLQELLEAEMTAHLHAEPYERSTERRGYRNGYKPQQLNTRVGTLTLQMPQDRDGTFSTQLFARYQRSEKALVLALMEMYVEGVSTRKVREVTEVLCGTSFSKSLISELAGQMDAEMDAWRNRPLTQSTYPYLSVDARYEHVRQDGQIVSQGALIVAGVRTDGHREILAVTVADTESEATYHHLFADLKARGLSGVRLVTSDAHKGLKAAIGRHFQGASWQRCQVHFSRDLIGMVGAGRRGELAADLREIFAATTREQALLTAETVAARWESSHPAVARLLDEGSEDCLACLAFPSAHRARLRTTNGLERLNEEIKRRTRVVRIFPNSAACLRLVTALCVEQSEEWVSGRRYLDIGALTAGDCAPTIAATSCRTRQLQASAPPV